MAGMQWLTNVMEHRYVAGCTEFNNGVQSALILPSDVTQQQKQWLVFTETADAVFTSSCRVKSLGKNFVCTNLQTALQFKIRCSLHRYLCSMTLMAANFINETVRSLNPDSRLPLKVPL